MVFRFRCYLSKIGLTKSIVSSLVPRDRSPVALPYRTPGSMRIGDRVIVMGLTGRTELNGVAGSVTNLAAGQNADRVAVRLDGYAAEGIALRAECLQPESTKRPREPRSSLTPLLQGLVDTALQLEDRTSPAVALAQVRRPWRQLRVCAANVPPGLATNKIEDGVQILTGVQSDEDGAKWHARRSVMATQLRAVGAGLVLHQELCGHKLDELLAEADCGLVPVRSRWCCPISYDPSILQPVATRRLIIGSAPGKFLGEGECSCAFGQWVSACSCFRDGHWRAGGATYAAFRFSDSTRGTVDLVALSSHLTCRSPAVRARGAEEVLAPLVKLLANHYEAPVILGGDFNMTKLQSADKSDKRTSGCARGVYHHLVGDLEAHRRELAAGLEAYLHAWDQHSSYEEEDDDDEPPERPAPVCCDTWEVARHLGTSEANGCKASTCHNWHGLSWDYARVQAQASR